MNLVHLSAKWIENHGSFVGKVNPNGHLVLEHDTFGGTDKATLVQLSRILPKFLIHDLERCTVIYETRGGQELRREGFTLWLKECRVNDVDTDFVGSLLKGEKDGNGSLTLRPQVPGHTVPMNTYQMIIRYDGVIDGRPYQKTLAFIPIKRDMRLVVAPPAVRRPAPTTQGGSGQ